MFLAFDIKRGGKRIDNRAVVKKDWIIELPDVLIVKILSLLPTKSAIATSVLSKKWQFHWTMLPKLSFNNCNHTTERGTFSKNVCKVLLSHKAPVLESLNLSFSPYNCEDMDIETWIEIANARHIRNLVLDVECKSFYYSFPKSLYHCESLKTLILKLLVYVNVPSKVCLKSLKTLHLHSVYFGDKASLVHFLSGCPNLENLLLGLRGYFSGVEVTQSTISVPSLQRLSIYVYSIYGRTMGCGYVIDAPSLKYLKIEGEHCLKFRLTKNVTKLEEADIVDASHTINENLLRSLTSVRRLSLELLPLKEFKFPTGSIFNQLVYLEIYTTTNAWWDLLTFMLDSSPILQVLKLINTQKRDGWRQGLKANRKWKQPKNVPECLLFHLETFMWTGSDEGLVEEEKEVAKYILMNTNLLERASFSSIRMSSEDRLELESVQRRDGGNMNEDRISKLPDVLILQILSQLPTKSAVATSVLSKQWQFLWKMMPQLKFDSCDHKGEVGTFSDNVCNSLLSHKAPFLESFHLSFNVDTCDAMDIGVCIGIARAQHVRKLVLDIESKRESALILPSSMCNCGILETLTLKGFIYLRDPSQGFLKSLKTLHLYPGKSHTWTLINTFLSGCPNLENLSMHLHGASLMKTRTIPMASVQRLSIYCGRHGLHNCGYVLNAPSLRYLKIVGSCRCWFGRAFENVTTLVEAKISHVSKVMDEKFLRSLTSVKRLSLKILHYKITFSTGIIFDQLVCLEIYTSQEAWWNLLTSMLATSPKLQVLKLINSNKERVWRKNRTLNQPDYNFTTCLLFHLETFMWSGYNKFLVKEEKEVANYILANAYRLKKATFSINNTRSGDRGELIKELKSVVRRSNSCELLFK
ncbi:unnamed protein product [Microthlaspi erraticum]|uniref:F-box domain-containing protein n=1 Tax=Microthlaspi erraticum TaxID=1685480 RepID=A0A6D2JL76_9BRAS|nr:unnamed protein product [Microthlaspi erraticum]CAA7054999.1 unnamed protein product [Microthlaspi erraticum]